jgi:hypothetical protein
MFRGNENVSARSVTLCGHLLTCFIPDQNQRVFLVEKNNLQREELLYIIAYKNGRIVGDAISDHLNWDCGIESHLSH